MKVIPSGLRWILAFVLLGAIIFWLALIASPSAPSRSLDFVIKPKVADFGLQNTLTIVLSNCSDCTLLYDGTSRTPGYEVIYSINSSLHTNSLASIGENHKNLPPHSIITSQVEIPREVNSVRVGLYVTSLTWRGRAALVLNGRGLSSVLDPITRLLARQDIEKRSKFEWSDEFILHR